MQEQLRTRWVPVVIAMCALCDDPAVGTAVVDTSDVSFSIELCASHLREILEGARPAPSD